MNTKSYTATNAEIITLVEKYQQFQQPNKNQYIKYFFKTPTETISIYTTNKVVIQAKNDTGTNQTNKIDDEFIEHAGSDESGTGDYFGPITVCACIVEKKDVQLLTQLNIKDSKQISDTTILKIAPILIKNLKYSLLVLDNKKYNELNATLNQNALKALLHNQAYLNLISKFNVPDRKIIDQFAEKKLYYNYLKNKQIVELEFHIKAENKFLAVAAASIIARYAFLKKMENLSKSVSMDLPLGAGKQVDIAGKKLVEKHGENILLEISKYHFANTKKILG